jgi:hypothetical protein
MRGCPILAVLAVLLMVSSVAQSAPVDEAVGRYNLPGKPPYLLAHYMAWYSTPWSAVTGSSIDRTAPVWSHWQWEGKDHPHRPDQKLPNGRRDIASVVYPLIGIYDSSSGAVIHYHLATMKAAGISGLTSIWYGPGSDTDKRLPLLLDEAEKLQMRVAICYEEKLNFPHYRHPQNRDDIVKSATDDLTYIIRTYGGHPAYLQRNGRPVIAQFNGYGTDPVAGKMNLSPDEWRRVFSALPSKIEFIRQNLDETYHPPIPAAYVWWNQGDWPARFAKQAADLRGQGRLDFFMTMVCPGFNDTGVWGWGNGPRISKGYGLDVLKWTTDQALHGNPELVQMVTWNDFNESTCFEPTVQHGFQFLQALGTWWSHQTGKPVHLSELTTPFEQYRRTCSAAERAEIPPTPRK